mgnify:CR=1 FL=1
MDNIIVRLLELKINNLKNVENGIINFINSGIDKTLNLKYGDVLGIYGQNGSGKTTVIEALEILKNLLIGTPLDTELKNLITYGKKEANLSFKFYIEIDNKKYIIVYEVKLEKDEKEKVEVSNEIIKYSLYENDSWKKMQLLVEIPYSDIAIKPKKYFKDIFEKNILIKFMVAQGLSKELGMSFLFSDKAKDFLYSNNELKDILTALEYYGKMNLFIVSNKDIGLITLNLILPLKVKRLNSGGELLIKIDKQDNIVVNEKVYFYVEDTINEINIVLKKIIPNLQLKLEFLKKEIIDENTTNIIADLHSVRNGQPISLRYESEGIKRIISILGVLIAVYHQPSVCLAIDELDSGIFEYLLGEILEILSTEIKGQLIFTSHNLRILEKIDNNNIIFSTTNPNNRYITFKYVKPLNNLRDMYIRELVIQEQKEKLYEETNQYDIKRAFYRAGVINGKK